MTKVQLSLTNQEADILTRYGSQFGYNLSKTIRFIISKASEDFISQNNIPVFTINKEQEELGLKALANHEAGKTTEIKDIDNYFDSL